MCENNPKLTNIVTEPEAITSQIEHENRPENKLSKAGNFSRQSAKKQRNRKTNKPKRIYENIETDSPVVNVQEDEYSTDQKDSHNQLASSDLPQSKLDLVSTKQDSSKPKEDFDTKGSSDILSFIEVQNPGGNSIETQEGPGFKQETLQGFVVDQWCDLGPSVHKEGHSPHRDVQSPFFHTCEESEGLVLKESPNSKINADPQYFTNTSQIDLDQDSNQERYSPGQYKVNAKSEDVKNEADKIEAEGKDMESPAVESETKFSLGAIKTPTKDNLTLQTALQSPYPGNTQSFSVQVNPFPTALFSTKPPRFPVQSCAAEVSKPLSDSNFVSSAQNIIPLGSELGKMCGGLNFHQTGSKGEDLYASKVLGLEEHTQVLKNNEQTVLCTEQMAMALFNPTGHYTVSSAASQPFSTNSANISTSDNVFTNAASHTGIGLPGVICPDSFFQHATLHPLGMMFLSPPPYFVQQIPYCALMPNTNYRQSQTHLITSNFYHGVSLEQNVEAITATTESSTSGEKTVEQKDACTDDNSVGKPNKMDIADANLMPSTLVVQQPLRSTLKPKMTGGSDFIDPTRIKFGADDDDVTDEDTEKMSYNSNTSDEEWYPNKTRWKFGNGQTGSGDGSCGWEGGLSAMEEEEEEAEDSDSPRGREGRRRRRPLKHPVKCEECGKIFQGKYHLRRHQMSHSEIRPYQCQVCDKSFKQKAHLHGHQAVHDKSLKQTQEKGQRRKLKSENDATRCPGRPRKAYSEKDLSCKQCGKSFKTVYRRKRHEQSHTDLRPFACRICGKGFKQTGHRNEHEINHEKTKKRFLCSMCGVVFRCRSSFTNHMRSHSIEKLRLQQTKDNSLGNDDEPKQGSGEISHTGYDCPYCSDKFATAQALNSHLESHVEVRQRRHVQPYSCDICRRAFTYRHNLLKHKLLHKAPEKYAHFHKEKIEAHVASGKPSFRCFVCSKVFIRKETLAKHFKIHSGNKPYKCSICYRDFTQNVHLKVHMRKHTGSRPFQCNECSKGFIDSTALAKHIEYEACNSDNSLYHCKICDKRHYYLGSIKQHIRKEHGLDEDQIETHMVKSERTRKRKNPTDGEKHGCKICSWNFTEKCNLVRHVKRKHSELIELLKKERSLIESSIPSENEKSNRDASSSRSMKSLSNTSINLTLKKTPVSMLDRDIVSTDHDEDSRHLLIDDCTLEDSTNSFTYSSDKPKQTDLTTKRGQFDFILRENNLHCGQPGSSEKSGFSGRQRQHSADFVEDNEKAESVKETEEENKGGLLEGFKGVEFVSIERHSNHENITEKLSAHRESCIKTADEVKKMSTQFEDCFEQSNVRTSLSKKDLLDEEASSPTDINFLYNIGLTVSSRAKKLSHNVSKSAFKKKDSALNVDERMNALSSDESNSTSSTDKKGSGLSDEVFLPYFSQELEAKSKASVSERFSDLDEALAERERTENSMQVVFCKHIRDEDKALNASVSPDQPKGTKYKLMQNIPNVKLKVKSPSKQFTYSDIQDSTHTCTLEQTKGQSMRDQPDRSFNDTVNDTKSANKCQISPQALPCSSDKTRQTIYHAEAAQQTEITEDILEGQERSATITSGVEMTSLYSTSSTECKSIKKGASLESASTTPLPKKPKDNSSQLSPGPELTMPLHRRPRKGPRQLRFDISDGCHLLEATHLPNYNFDHDKDATLSFNETHFQPEVRNPQKYFLGVEKPKPVTVTLDNLETPGNHSRGTNCKSNSDSNSSSNIFLPKRTGSSELTNEEFNNLGSLCSLPNSLSNQKITSDSTRYSPSSAIVSDQFQSKYPSSGSKSVDDFESCPTESHLKYLGLLACRDSKELENKSFPLQTLYATFKPWLEKLVFSNRSRRTKRIARAKTAQTAMKSMDSEQDLKTLTIIVDPEEDTTSHDIVQSKPNNVTISESTSKTPIVSQSEQPSKTEPTEKKEPCILKRKRLPRKRVEIDNSNDKATFNKAKGKPNQMEGDSHTQATDNIACTTTTVSVPTEGVLYDNKPGERKVLSSQPPAQSYLDAFITAPAFVSPRVEKELAKSSPSAKANSVKLREGSSFHVQNSTTSTASVDATAPPTLSATKVPLSVIGIPSHVTADSTERGRNQFPCAVCGKAFTARHQLKRHEMTHTDHRPYKCEKCGRAFRQKVHLSDHIKRHQGQRPFVCQGCGKRFVLKNEMNQHVKNHCKGSTHATVLGAASSGTKNPIVVNFEKTPCVTQSDPTIDVKPKQDTPLVSQGENPKEAATSHGQQCKPGDRNYHLKRNKNSSRRRFCRGAKYRKTRGIEGKFNKFVR